MLLKKEVSVRFGTRSALKSPPHVTIVPPFFCSEEEKLLEMVQQHRLPCKIQMNGFGAFAPRVVYIQVANEWEMLPLYVKFTEVFYTCFPSLRSTVSYPFKPHITIGNRDWHEDNFNACWNEMKERTFIGTSRINGLSVLKYVDGIWQLLTPNE